MTRPRMAGCPRCGKTVTAECVDNFGNKYIGYPCCRIKTKKEIDVSPSQLHTRLTQCEVDATLAPDCRETLRHERESLGLAMASGDGKRIQRAADEARRVARMWGIEAGGNGG